jgi:transcriptional regulator with XRE-family HTH domain
LIGLKVKKYLDENGIKYSYLSEKAGIPMNLLSPTLNGKRKMSVEEYFRICEVLGLPAETFAPANHQSNE